MPFDRRVQIDVIRPPATVALRIEGLRVVFDVSKNAKTSANQARIQIYNLSPDTRSSRFQELKDQIIVRAGYADESLDEIFHGDMMSISHPSNEADIVTTIIANDGQGALRRSHANLSYAENTSVKQVVQDIAKSFGIPVKTEDYLRLMSSDKFIQGFTFNGRSQDALDKVAARAGLEWSIQGNQLQILKKGTAVPKALAQIPVLSPEHGLIGSPERLQQVTDESPEKKPPGWRIKSVLIGRLEPGGQVGLRCQDIPRAQALRIESVHHKGDTHGEEWSTTTEALDSGILIEGPGA